MDGITPDFCKAIREGCDKRISLLERRLDCMESKFNKLLIVGYTTLGALILNLILMVIKK